MIKTLKQYLSLRRVKEKCKHEILGKELIGLSEFLEMPNNETLKQCKKCGDLKKVLRIQTTKIL